MKIYNGYISEYGRIEPKEWDLAIKVPAMQLYHSISEILDLRNKIEDSLQGNILESINNNTNIRQILLGGIDNKGEYLRPSLAEIYRNIFGISIDPKIYISSYIASKQGIDLEIDVKYEDTKFLQFMKDVKENIDRIPNLSGDYDTYRPSKTTENIFKSPDLIKDLLITIYEQSVSISANVNDHVFFILNTRGIPRCYIERTYFKIKDQFEELATLIGLIPIFVPKTKDEKMKNDYTLWTHEEGRYADSVYMLNNTIWKYFEMKEFTDIFAPFVIVEHLKLMYINKVEKDMSRVGWKFPSYIDPILYGGNKAPYWHKEYKINGEFLDRCYEIPSWKSKSIQEVKFDIKSIIELFEDISLALFLGYITYENEKYKGYDNTSQTVYSHISDGIYKYILRIDGDMLSIQKRR